MGWAGIGCPEEDWEFDCVQLKIEKKLKGILRDYIHRLEVVQHRASVSNDGCALMMVA